MKSRTLKRWLPWLAVSLAAGQVALILVSWLIAAAMPQSGVHSLLSSEGVRWFFSQFVHAVGCPPVVWLILLSMGWGALNVGGLREMLASLMQKDSHRMTYRERFALVMVITEALLVLVVMLLLTCTPHAVLLNVTGGLSSGAFPDSVIPVFSFLMVLTGLTYGALCGRLSSLQEACEALASGIRSTASWWLIAVLGAEFYASLVFVFCG